MAVFNVAGLPLRSGDLAHGVVESHFQNLDKEVDGIARQVALRPTPVTFLEGVGPLKGSVLNFDTE